MVGFFTGVTASSYMDWMTEYNTPTQAIGRGTYHGHTTITPSLLNNAPTVDDANNIQPELLAQLQSGALPAPEVDAGGNVNTLYALFFPQGKVITEGGTVGGQDGGFCAYHGTVDFNGLLVPYMVLPDFDDPLAHYDQGCGNAPNLFDNFTSVVGHELIESVTDPGVGLAQFLGPPLGWYDDDNNNGEIADICVGGEGTVLGGDGHRYVVQQEFSNVSHNCLTGPAGFASACANASPGEFADAGLAADCLKLYGVALGKDDGTFGENDPLRRSQVSSLLARLASLANTALTQTRAFPDVNATTLPNAQVRNEIELLAGSGIIAGFPDGLFHPELNLTVAQGATLVVRTLQLIRASHTAAPKLSDRGSTGVNHQYAIANGILETNAGYPSQPLDTTLRGLLADMLAQSVQKLVRAGVVDLAS
jgi:hypothetical protein